MLCKLLLDNALPKYRSSDESKLLTASQLNSRTNGVHLKTVLQNHKNAKDKLTIVWINNMSQSFLYFEFQMIPEDLLTTFGEHLTVNVSYDCICQSTCGPFTDVVMKRRVERDWLAMFNRYCDAICSYNSDTPLKTPSPYIPWSPCPPRNFWNWTSLCSTPYGPFYSTKYK